MNVIALLWVLLVLVVGTQFLINRYIILERYQTQMALEHLTPHFGGIPNQSQVWGYMVKYPREYV